MGGKWGFLKVPQKHTGIRSNCKQNGPESRVKPGNIHPTVPSFFYAVRVHLISPPRIRSSVRPHSSSRLQRFTGSLLCFGSSLVLAFQRRVSTRIPLFPKPFWSLVIAVVLPLASSSFCLLCVPRHLPFALHSTHQFHGENVTSYFIIGKSMSKIMS